MSLLARDPADRPTSATELRERLDALSVARWTDQQAVDWWRLRGSVSA